MLLKFWYENWKGRAYIYVIRLDPNKPMSYDSPAGSGQKTGWYLHGTCLSRDGAIRRGAPRRSFRLEDMKGLEECAKSDGSN